MNCMLPTKHPSFFWFLLQGRFWVLQQWGSSCLLQEREGRKCPGGSVPVWRALPAARPHSPSHTATASLQVTAEPQRRAVAVVAGVWPAHQLKWTCIVHHSFWSALHIPGGRAGGRNCPTWNRDKGGWKKSLESAEKVPKQALAGRWRGGCVVSVLQVWAWLMRKLWREANSPSAWQFQPFLTRVGLGTDREEHRDCTARAVQVTDEYQGSKMLLLDLSAVFDALRYCWVAFDPRQE